MPKSNWYEIKAAAEGSRAEVYIYGPIVSEQWFEDEVAAKPFIDHLNSLDVQDIDLYINSPGGAVFAGFAIHNALRRHQAQVHTHIDGLAASIASVIALAGDIVTMGDNAMFMIHDPWSLAIGNAADMRKMADTLDRVKEATLNTYEGRSNLTREELATAMSEETWYTAQEAVAAGFVDDVFEGTRAAASIPAGVFNNVPASLQGRAPHHVPDPKEGIMPKPATAPAPENKPDENAIRDEARAEALAAEKQRRDAINALFDKHPAMNDLRRECIDNMDMTVQEASTKLIDALSEGAEPLGSDVRIVEDERDKFRDGVVKGALIRARVIKDDGTNEFRRFGLKDAARACLEMAGVRTHNMSTDQIIKAALTHSTSDFPNIYENVMHKTLLEAFRAAPDTWRQFCAVGDLSDFRPHNRYRAGSFGDLQSLQENGELKHVTIGDAEKESISADEQGMIFALTYKMIVNDDLGAFLNIARALGRAAARSVENDVYALLALNSSAGPQMSDGTNMFHANHGNLAGTGGAISVSTIGAARAAMLKQKDPGDNEYLDIQPRILLCPVELGDGARQVVAAETDISKQNSRTPNPIRNIVDVVETPRLSGNGWYIFAAPGDIPAIEVGFLNGQTEPSVELEESFDSRGVKYRVTFDYGTAAVEYRSAYRNPGA